MIIACERTRDFDRAGQWCERLAAFCERTGQRSRARGHAKLAHVMNPQVPAYGRALRRLAG